MYEERINTDEAAAGHNFEQKKLETIVLHAINNQVRIVVEMEQVLREINQKELSSARIKRLDLLIAQKEKDIDGYQEFRMKLYEALKDELIDRSEYERMRQKYAQMIEEAETGLKRLLTERQMTLSNEYKDDGWIAQFLKFNGLQELTREAVVSLIDRVEVYQDKQLRIVFNYRDEIARYQELIEQTKKEVG